MARKVSLITVHTGPNFGTVLQVIATVRVLQQNGLETEVVNYIPPRDELARFIKDTKEHILQGKNIIRKAFRLYGGLRGFQSFKKNDSIYIGCLKNFVTLSEPILSSDLFTEKCPKADFYVTGSDQVWNTVYNEGVDSHYFFDGINGTKIAFSSSIGQTDLSEEEKSLFAKYLKEYKRISVRESSAVKMLSEIGIPSVNLIDPTLMLNRNDWGDILNGTRLHKKDYLLVYIPYNIHDKEEIYSLARRVARSKGLQIITFSWTRTKEPLADFTYRDASPLDFLSLMYHASFVITNSFHGTAFSINLNRDFFVFLPTEFVSRVEDILTMVDLKSRLVPYGEIDSVNVGESIDYTKANTILESKRSEVRDFIKEAFV